MPRRGYRKEYPLLKCDHCDYSTRRPPFLVDHARVHTGERPFACEICGKAFTQKSNLGQHMKTHGKGDRKMWHCDKCDFVSKWKSSLIIHERWHRGEKPYKCTLCDQSFSQSTHCRSHIREMHSEARRFQCDRCSRCFKRQEHLDRHVAFHIQNKQFPCDICGKMFIELVGVRQHRRIHMGEEGKIYKCDHCPYKSYFRQCLVVHQRIHTGVKPYPCASCPKKFRTTSTLKIHTRMVHMGLAGKIFKCDKCDFATANNQSLKKHNRRIHQGIKEQFVVRCKICKRIYTTRSSYYGHRAKLHPELWKTHSSGRPSKSVKTELPDSLLPEILKQGLIKCPSKSSNSFKEKGPSDSAKEKGLIQRKSQRVKKRKVYNEDAEFEKDLENSDEEELKKGIKKDDVSDSVAVPAEVRVGNNGGETDTKSYNPSRQLHRGPMRTKVQKNIGLIDEKDELDKYMFIGSLSEIDCSIMKTTILAGGPKKKYMAKTSKSKDNPPKQEIKAAPKVNRRRRNTKEDEIDKYIIILDQQPSGSKDVREQSAIRDKPNCELNGADPVKKTKIPAPRIKKTLRDKPNCKLNAEDLVKKTKLQASRIKKIIRGKKNDDGKKEKKTVVSRRPRKETPGFGSPQSASSALVVKENAITGLEKPFSSLVTSSYEEEDRAGMMSRSYISAGHSRQPDISTGIAPSLQDEVNKLDQLGKAGGSLNNDLSMTEMKPELVTSGIIDVKPDPDEVEFKPESQSDVNSLVDFTSGLNSCSDLVKPESSSITDVEVKSEPVLEHTDATLGNSHHVPELSAAGPEDLDNVIIIDDSDEPSDFSGSVEVKTESDNLQSMEVKSELESGEVNNEPVNSDPLLSTSGAIQFKSTSLCPFTRSFQLSSPLSTPQAILTTDIPSRIITIKPQADSSATSNVTINSQSSSVGNSKTAELGNPKLALSEQPDDPESSPKIASSVESVPPLQPQTSTNTPLPKSPTTKPSEEISSTPTVNLSIPPSEHDRDGTPACHDNPSSVIHYTKLVTCAKEKVNVESSAVSQNTTVKRVIMLPEKMVQRLTNAKTVQVKAPQVKPDVEQVKVTPVKEYSSLRDLAKRYIGGVTTPKSPVITPSRLNHNPASHSKAKAAKPKSSPAIIETITIDD